METLFVVSRSPDGAAARHDFEDALARALAQRGNVLVVPHLYYLCPDHAAITRLRSWDGRLAVGTWMYPRPARWTLAALGVDAAGERACYHSMGAFSAVADCAGEMGGKLPLRSDGRIEELTDPVEPRWYPVLDYSRCTGCGRCLDFCLFGTYSREDRRVVATSPDSCKPGCPACARVCPSGAIMFPHHGDDPAIAGAPGEEVEVRPIDVERFFQRVRAKALQTANPVESGQTAGVPQEDVTPPAADKDLGDLIQALDEFDE